MVSLTGIAHVNSNKKIVPKNSGENHLPNLGLHSRRLFIALT